ncbi:MAG: metal ABC transporter permease [Rectinemataceae bacterium]
MEDLIRSQLFSNAIVGGTMVAAVAGLVGYFLVLRALAFASEALTDISFAGATGAALLGVSPIAGMVVLGLGAVLCLGQFSERMRGRDIEIGMVLSFALGLGVLFLNLYAHSSAAHAATGVKVLFGSLMSVKAGDIAVTAVLAAAVVLCLAVIGRPLLFASVDPTVAQVRGVPLRALSMVFLALLAVTTAIGVLVIGVLLAVSLLIAPAASAVNFGRRPVPGIMLAVGFGVAVVWIGLILEFFGPWRHVPIGFYVSFLSSLLYLVSLLWKRFVSGAAAGGPAHPDREVRHEA